MNRRTVLKTLTRIPFTLPILPMIAQEHQLLPSHHNGSGFINVDPNYVEAGFMEMMPWILGKIPDAFKKAERADIPRKFNDGSVIKKNKSYTATWIGHSTVLLQMEGKTILTDPVWSDRVGPLKFAGTSRVSEPGVDIEKLPQLDIILISHNHYDHLDELTIEQLVDKHPNVRFYVPLKVGDWFKDKGITNIVEYDWWEGGTFLDLKIICTPAQHFSGRWFNDRNTTLWCSWTIIGKNKKLFFGGDSGYCSHFNAIGKKFGSFELTLLPIGAYAPRTLMKPVHMNPEEAVQANNDLRGKTMVGIHWGTFQMTDEPIIEPSQKLREVVHAQKLSQEAIRTLKIGETIEW